MEHIACIFIGEFFFSEPEEKYLFERNTRFTSSLDMSSLVGIGSFGIMPTYELEMLTELLST